MAKAKGAFTFKSSGKKKRKGRHAKSLTLSQRTIKYGKVKNRGQGK